MKKLNDRIEIHKFGGVSVGCAERMEAVAAIAIQAASQARIVVVTSAMSGVTDLLIQAASQAASGDRDSGLAIVDSLVNRHEDTLSALAGGVEAQVRKEIRRILGEIAELVRALSLLGELTGRTRDRILAAGEKLAVRLLALALRNQGRSASALDADEFLETDGVFGRAHPLADVTHRTISAAIRPCLERGEIPVITGFIGRGPDGATTTLGRGGSDLSATLIAAAMGADSVTIWTDVDGVYTANPRIVPEARVIRQLNYREAAEMSFYGAKVLHQNTMIPVTKAQIPVRIRNSLAPGSSGTVVDGRLTPGSHPVKAITAIGGQCLISIEGKGMAGVPGVAARAFEALARQAISVTMISQSSSEASICLAVPLQDMDGAEASLKAAFRPDLARGDVDEIVVRRGIGLVAAVGLGMAHTPGVAARVFAALGRRKINVLAIAQGSSELNISLAVAEPELEGAIRAIHEEFGLHRLDTGVDTTRNFDLLLLGFGNIGRTLTGMVGRRQDQFHRRFGLVPRIAAISDRSGYLFDPQGLSESRLAEAAQAKATGRPLVSLQGAIPCTDCPVMLREALSYRLARPVLVDVTASDESWSAFLEAFRLGCDVVTANKKPLAGPLERYREIMHGAADRGRLLKAEATVGAGMPIVDTLEMLLATGDSLTCAQGCFSGTLGFVMTRLEEGIPFPRAVAEAVDAGYTEPDPVADLSGEDVARKAVILGRLSGLVLSDDPVTLTGLVDPALAGLTLDQLLERLESYDEAMGQRIETARKAGLVLRYVATVRAGRIEVGPREVPVDSPLGMLKGTDNMVVFESERYAARPLVVAGPGAGAQVTAMGVLADILRVAAERR